MFALQCFADASISKIWLKSCIIYHYFYSHYFYSSCKYILRLYHFFPNSAIKYIIIVFKINNKIICCSRHYCVICCLDTYTDCLVSSINLLQPINWAFEGHQNKQFELVNLCMKKKTV